jgi:hypothetical protein
MECGCENNLKARRKSIPFCDGKAKFWDGAAGAEGNRGFAQEVFLAQRRKGAKKTLRNAAALCAFAREIFSA